MIVNVFGHWFEPTGIRLEDFEHNEDTKGVFVIFGSVSQTREYYDPARGFREGVCSAKDGIYIYGKTIEEVAEEINRQLKSLSNI